MMKRGLSPVIAVLLILLITVSAATIIAGFIIPFVKKNLSESTECFPYREYFKFEEVFDFKEQDTRYNCYQATNELHGISVRAGSLEMEEEEKIIGFNVLFIKSGSSESVKVVNGPITGKVRMLKLSKTNIIIPNSNEIQTYVYDADSQEGVYEKMEIYPIINNNGKDKTCPMSDSIKLILCEEEGIFNIQ